MVGVAAPQVAVNGAPRAYVYEGEFRAAVAAKTWLFVTIEEATSGYMDQRIRGSVNASHTELTVAITELLFSARAMAINDNPVLRSRMKKRLLGSGV